MRKEQYIQYLASQILYLMRPRWGKTHQIATSNLMALFMCGVVVTSAEDKAEILQVLETMSAENSLRSFTGAVNALKELYREQDRAAESGRDVKSVDWIPHLKEKGMLNFSLFGI